jgi:HD-like signal output (HDOD) protein
MEIKEKLIDLVRDKRMQLPTLPVVAINVMRIASNENASAQELASFINMDQAISNKVLRLANSAYYGLARQVDSIQRAISVIGFNEIVSLAIGIGVFSAFPKKSRAELLNMNGLWLHSIGCAYTAREMLRVVRPGSAADRAALTAEKSNGEQLFLSGLLHDIGKIFFVINFPGQYRGVLKEAHTTCQPLWQKEQELLELDHAAMAGMIMDRWNFPETLLMPSRYHHQPDQCPDRFATSALVVQLADSACHAAAVGQSGNPSSGPAEHAFERLGMTDRDFAKIVQFVRDKRLAIEQYLKVIS